MKIAIVDSHAICHSVKHSTRELSYRGEKTGVIYGFFRKIFAIQEKIKADAFIFAWDSKIEYFRKQIYPGYKFKEPEEKTPADFQLDDVALPQFDRLRDEILPGIGFSNNIMIEGLEADDIIAQIVNQYKSHQIIIISRDGDLYQLLNGERVVMFNPVAMKYYTEESLFIDYGTYSDKWAFVKAIAGCTSDNVIGVDGVAEKTAIKFLDDKLKPGKTIDKILEAEELVIDNLRLVLLPWETTPKISLVPDKKVYGAYLEMCKQQGMNTLLDKSAYAVYTGMLNFDKIL